MATTPPTTTLTQAYERIPATHRDVLEVLSALRTPLSRNLLLEYLAAAGVAPPDGGSWSHPKLAGVIHALAAAGLVEQAKTVTCTPSFREVALRRAAREGRLHQWGANVIKKARSLHWGRRTRDEILRDFRIELYLGRESAAWACLQEINLLGESPGEVLREVLGNPLDADVLSWAPQGLVAAYLATEVSCADVALEPPASLVLACARDGAKNSGGAGANLRRALAVHALLKGAWGEVHAWVKGDEEPETDALRGALAFLQGDDQAALAHYRVGLKRLRAATGKRKVFFAEIEGLFFVLALLRTGDPAGRKEASSHVQTVLSRPGGELRDTFLALDRLLAVLSGATPPVLASTFGLEDPEGSELARLLEEARRRGKPPLDPPATLDTLGQALCTYWLGRPRQNGKTAALEELCRKAEAGGYRWVEAEASALLAALGHPGYAEWARRAREELGGVALTGVVPREEPWERTLAAALDLFEPAEGRGAAPAQSEARLAWVVSWYETSATVRPVEQRRNAKGEWSQGKNVALKRLADQAQSLGFLTPQDLSVCGALATHRGHSYWDRPVLVLEPNSALRALVGHPLVFLDEAHGPRVEVVRGQPELRVERTARKLVLRVVPEPDDERDVQILRESPTRVRVVEFGPKERKLAELLGPKGLKVPAAAEERVRRMVSAAASQLTVHSDVDDLGALEAVPADPRPRVRLGNAGGGLRVEFVVLPFGDGGPQCAPGAGGRSLIAEVGGRKVATRRDLESEVRASEEVASACPSLAGAGEKPFAWVVSELDSCLDLLLELQALGDTVVVEWPEGETLRAPRPAALAGLQLDFRRQNDWFAAGGELWVDESLTLDLRRLLDLAAASPGRYLPLGDGRFLALTQAFRKRLDQLRTFTETHGKGLRFHPLAALNLEDLSNEVGSFRGDKGWKDQLRRYRDAQELTPEVPSTLTAELRPYQVDGYRWLARLAHWGVGACLADDMGLGKTLQALALLLTRAKNGPCLVVAPTSVCPNWASEAARFAPSLRPVLFGPGNREKVLASLQPFDVVLTSYGLLLQEAEPLSAVDWEVVVLDEAQAIKNAAAKRSQAALGLKAGFKMITTGTPVENHLGELWNLFRFLNPGLLGSHEGFRQKFALPIERDGDRTAQTRLKRLVSPFLLRRTKSQVLDDLPPRTEILRRVELGPQEAALYEALRTKALETLASSDGPPLAKHFQVLAELMRLRRACCHPRLVLPDAPADSAKLDAFGEILDDLLANRHKALVFSQFVDHLALVRAYVEQRGVAYQYLDGSTTAKERKRRVDAFQGGEGELFLISLKAGGLGLNLTAADYVVHLDPWWNPAVEDQASDRAYRIGQTRPVTVYRLVAAGTIEEKIVDLHHHKRDLADKLLEDADGGGRLSADELLEILRGE